MARNNLTFSLPLQVIEKLENMAIGGESPALVAKRLLLSLIEDTAPPPATPATVATDEIKELKEKINRLEGQLTRYILDEESDSGGDAGELAERVDDLALQIATIGESLNRTGPHGDQSVLVDRIIELEKKVEPIAIAYQEKLPIAEASDRIAELEEAVGKILEREFCGGGRAQVATVEDIKEAKSYFMTRLRTLENELEELQDLHERIDSLSDCINMLSEQLPSAAELTWQPEEEPSPQPKRRGRPPKGNK
jgi:chromosome segregation ATPase